MLKEEKKVNHELTKELREAQIYVCTKTEQIGKEYVTAAWDPTTDEPVDANDLSNWMTFEKALELKQNSPEYLNAGIGLVLKKEDPYFAIEILNAVSDGELSEVARETVDTLRGESYGEIVGSSLIMIVKGVSIGNQQFKNISVNYFDRDHIVPLTGHATWKPRSPWTESKGLEIIKEYHFKMNCQVDENSKQLPEHYVKTPKGLRLLPNVLASTLLKQKDYLMCNTLIYVRKKGEGIFQKVGNKEIKREIMDYLSPKYLTTKDVTETESLFSMRIPIDNELTDSKRMKGKINFKNGVYDIESSTFGPYAQNYKTAFQLNVEYQMDAQCPRFREYLAASLTKEDAKTVQEMMGYLLTTEVKAEKAFILYGPGNTGKSTLIEVIGKIIGKDYVSSVPFQNLGARFHTVKLCGKLLNSFADLPQEKIKDTGVFKALVSGDSMYADDK